MKKYRITTYSALGVMVMLLISMIFSCETQDNFRYKESETNGEELNINAWSFIQQTDSLSMLEQAIVLTGLQDYYNQESEKSFIAPDNSAFRDYLEDNGYTTLEEVPAPILRNALKYHIVKEEVSFTDPELAENDKPLPYETENGQLIYLSHDSNFRGKINQGTGQEWDIITSNIETLSGVVHVTQAIVFFSAPSGDLSVPDPSVKFDTINPVQDTFINGGSGSSTNYGSDVLLKVKNVDNAGDVDRKTYLMFDLREFDEGVITDLELQLSVKFTHGKGVGMYVYSVSDTLWTESGLTWDNATSVPDPSIDVPISSIDVTSKVTRFDFVLDGDYVTQMSDDRRKITLVLDGEAASNETDEFYSMENGDSSLLPQLVGRIVEANSSLVNIVANTGFSVESGGAFVLSKNVLEITGAATQDIIYTVEALPLNGWLIKGSTILQAGDKFTQQDIELMNLVYINNESGTEDEIVLSVKDKAGSSIDPFNVNITIE
ncbi:CBM96 family carbohydrate-binding protein [Abyssalbus ytuae]|uniref:DNRLRE domain-containing protein n=1 Tax=Abyssalbus ytuae TaxID=2926907 RepID=A0A9E6ZQ12_9FLAO|nr:DNRLRE domain-containing protein [Abyssalbus ytuae]UOB18395.1 DNRLRE domain-containing protein [Abyssalbus ytuae]